MSIDFIPMAIAVLTTEQIGLIWYANAIQHPEHELTIHLFFSLVNIVHTLLISHSIYWYSVENHGNRSALALMPGYNFFSSFLVQSIHTSELLQNLSCE